MTEGDASKQLRSDATGCMLAALVGGGIASWVIAAAAHEQGFAIAAAIMLSTAAALFTWREIADR